MKYIKTYERKLFPIRYKVGDYVLVDDPIGQDMQSRNLISSGEFSRKYAKIKRLHRTGSTKTQLFHDKIGSIIWGGQNYTVEYSDGNISLAISSKEVTAYSSLDWITLILRKLTSEEIDQFEMEKNANNYNI